MDVIGMALLWGLTLFLLLGVLLPLSKLPLGAIRGLEFPRQQYFLLAVFLIVCVYVLVPDWLGGWGGPLLILLAAVQLVYIVKFTPLWPVQSVAAHEVPEARQNDRVSILAANIKLSNRDVAPFAELMSEKSPDIAIVVEVDETWTKELRARLGQAYPHQIAVPKDNGYGMLVLSRLTLAEAEVRELVTRNVPSVKARVVMADGQAFRLYAVHPEPPTFSHDTKGRDSEIALVGLEAAQDPLPAVVAGDLNDVAWSTTTRRFQRLSGLLDPRVGRGFYNTFSATMPWMRWPLDHLFHDPRFRLVEMARLRKIGSDHFPMWFVLELRALRAAGSDPGERDEGEAFAAKRMIVKEKKRERRPIGEDWEDQ